MVRDYVVADKLKKSNSAERSFIAYSKNFNASIFQTNSQNPHAYLSLKKNVQLTLPVIDTNCKS